MMCGAKCFIVQFVENGKVKHERILARTPAKARKTARLLIGNDQHIISVVGAR